jgi:hypothetical protein
MKHSFDELAKSVARGMPRREALFRLGGIVAAGGFATLGLGRARADTRHKCQAYCSQFPLGNQRRRCQAVCAQCPDVSMMCGTTGLNVVCCPGACCSGQCTNTNFDVNNCGMCGHACASGALCCSGTCADPNSDGNNCGACGMVCGPVNQASMVGCAGGQCHVFACNAGFGDCNGIYGDGCETNTNNDVQNCGACGMVCGPVNQASMVGCTGGQCHVLACNAGFADCNGVYSDGCESNLSTDAQNCGFCGNVCPGTAHGVPKCITGACTIRCNTGYKDCGDGLCIPNSQLCM